MRPLSRGVLCVLLLSWSFTLVAQRAPDPSGHWEGTVQIPDMPMAIEVDLTRSASGALTGTFSQPAQGVKGLPLATAAVDGLAVRFVVKGGDAPSTFTGELSSDGQSIAGNVEMSGYSIPFALARKGDARVTPLPRSAAIGKELEGSWNGTLEVPGKPMRVVLKMTNQPDGTAAGSIASPDGSGVEIPIAMTQKDSTLTIQVPSVDASYVGTLNAARTELVGTWTQRASSLPLTFRRVVEKDVKR